MYIYIILLTLASILYYSRNNKNNMLFIVFLILAIGIAGFRDMIGGYDVYIYSEIYESLDKIKNLYITFEPGFVLYYKALRVFNEDRYFMFFVSSCIVLGFYIYYLKKISVFFYFSLFIFFCKFYLMSFVYLRQGLAMVLVFSSLYFLLKHKKKWAILLAIAAIFTHKSAIVFLPFIFVCNLKFSYLQITFIIAVIALLSFSPLGTILLSNAGDALNEEKITAYANKTGSVNIFYIIEGFIILVLAFFFRDKFYANKNTIIYYNGILFYGLIIIFGITNATFVRLAWYYFMFICLGLPYIYYFIDFKNIKQLFRNMVFVYYALIFIRLMIVFDGGDFMPYKSIFQDFDRKGIWEYREYR
jgi:hypothetical protein